MDWKKGCLGLFLACCFPYVVTLGWTGSIGGREGVLESARPGLLSGKQVILDRFEDSPGGGELPGIPGEREPEVLDVEEYLVGVVALQMPADYEPEALKAQAIIARTYIYGQMGGQDSIRESALDMDYLEQAQMERLWGTKDFVEFYRKVEGAVADTNSLVMEYQGECIEPWFSRCSAGKTRKGDERHPYFASVDCPKDLEAEGYLQMEEWTKEEFSRKISQIPGERPVSADQVPETIQIGERDEAGYVVLVQIGNYQFTGDEIRYALGLNSSHFRLEDYEGNIRAVVKGIGHGYGMSQYDANRKAKDGWSAEEILSYFYENILLVSE